ncbi:nucleoside/nucleotide kinase family protein [Delftia acidovorans]
MTAILPPEALARAFALARSGPRRLLGLAGPPGAGKSTVCAALLQALGPLAAAVPMDGFHLAQSALERLGRAQRKGAPDTFDSAGYVALLRRLHTPVAGETVYAPEFRRAIEEPIAGAIAIAPGVPLVITEGNYLLMDEQDAPGTHWHAVRALLDEVWYVDMDDRLRIDRLTRRHELHGRSPQAARDWVAQVDEPNARRIAATRGRADWVLRWG